MERIFHPYHMWEDMKAGMFNHDSVIESEEKVNDCIELLTNRGSFYETMCRLSVEWIYSAESNLSYSNNNRRAWLGRASCCFSFGYPENITQTAWIKMTPEERKEANLTADMFLSDWEQKYNGQPNLWEAVDA